LFRSYKELGSSAETALKRVDKFNELMTSYVEIRNKLVAPNIRLVLSIARQFQNRGVSLSDLIAGGNLGLIKAADKFNPSRLCRFSTCAYHWIRQAIQRFIKEEKNKRGVGMTYANALKSVGDELMQELGRRPNREELLTSWMMSRQGNLKHDKTCSKERAYQAEIHKLEKIQKAPLSLQRSTKPYSSAESFNYEIQDPAQSVLDRLIEMDRERAIPKLIQRVFSTLDERDADIMRMRFGIGQEPKTLQEVGNKYGLTKERVRQIEDRALRKALNFLGESAKVLDIVGGIPERPKIRKGRGAEAKQ
jgi:RNA polymerase primary sigma factor